jgi:hypothetical protein
MRDTLHSLLRQALRVCSGLLIGIFGVVAVDNAHACDPCGVHSAVQVPGLMNALRTTGLQPAAWTLGISEQFSTFDVRGENDLRTTNTDLELIRNLSVTQFSLSYNVSSQVAVQVNAPLVVRNYDHFERFSKVRDTEAGLGDASILTTFSPYSYTDVEERFFVAGVAGLKLPTGDTGSLTRVANEGAESADVRIQGRGLTLGTGSVDMPVGLVTYARSGRWQVFGSAQYTFRTEGAADYRFADDLAWSAAPGWLFVLGEERSLSCSLVISGEDKGSDRLAGEALPRTAAHNVYLGPELFYAVSNKLSVQVGIDLPIALDVGGAAVEPETRSRLALSWIF